MTTPISPLTHSGLFESKEAHVNLLVGPKGAGKWSLLSQWLDTLRTNGQMDHLLIVSPYHVKAKETSLNSFHWTPNFANLKWLDTLEDLIMGKPKDERWVLVLNQCFWNPTVHKHRLFRRLFTDAASLGVILFEMRLQMPKDMDSDILDTLVVFPQSTKRGHYSKWNEEALALMVFEAKRIGEDIGKYETVVADFTQRTSTRQAVLGKIDLKPMSLDGVVPFPKPKKENEPKSKVEDESKADETSNEEEETKEEYEMVEPSGGIFSWLKSWFV